MDHININWLKNNSVCQPSITSFKEAFGNKRVPLTPKNVKIFLKYVGWSEISSWMSLSLFRTTTPLKTELMEYLLKTSDNFIGCQCFHCELRFISPKRRPKAFYQIIKRL
jgi:hypothetical protein